MEVRYVVETGLDVHVVSHIEREANNLKLTVINPSRISTTTLPLEQVLSITKETITSEDVTETYKNKLLAV